MDLAQFLDIEREKILYEAVTFAATLPALQGADTAELRDHLPQLLDAIRLDLGTPQTRAQSITKSHGKAPAQTSESAAQTHGSLRARQGLHIEQLVAEYRALRSSVLRLWGEAHPAGPHALEEIGRFNEAVDQAVAESVQFFSAEVETWREIFLAMLGHDLRAPLNAMALTTELLGKMAPPPLQSHVATLERGVQRLNVLLDSLLEHSRSKLQGRLAVSKGPGDVALACADEVELLRAEFPQASIELVVDGNAEACFDASRVKEALNNLVSNAVRHGTAGSPCVIQLESDASAIRLHVENAGTLPAGEIERLFDPLHRGMKRGDARDGHLGLGLYIAREIARAHGGDISGSSEQGKVRFTMVLPRTTAEG